MQRHIFPLLGKELQVMQYQRLWKINNNLNIRTLFVGKVVFNPPQKAHLRNQTPWFEPVPLQEKHFQLFY